MSEEEPKFVPARYIGGHVVDLSRTGKKWFNIDGTPRTDLQLFNGDTVMIPAQEVLGQTLFNDVITGKQFNLGPGRVVKAKHQEVPEDQLGPLGYEFHDGRPDFELVEVVPKTPKRSKQAPKEVPTSLEIDASNIAEEVD